MERLRATFIAGPQSGLTAQDTFTNRVSEVEAFRRSLAAITESRTTSGANIGVDLTSPRRNVLVYYGLGGIGKTTLSRYLERGLSSGAIESSRAARQAVARIDFGESGDFDQEIFLLRLRAGLGPLRKSWPAFDVAFRIYWERTHPGESLPEFVRKNSILRQHAARFEFAEQVQDIATQILGEIGMAWAPARVAVRLASLTRDRLAQSITYRRLMEGCPFFEPIVAQDPTAETLSYMPSLLGWELDQADHSSLAVVFLDTFEAVSGRGTREVERLIQRAIFLLPTVLFVVTSRNHLDWAEPSFTGELDYTGIERWSQLYLENKESEPRQHLVGALSGRDCDQYLQNVLRNHDGSPAIATRLRDRIVQGSEGIPLYLDLAVTQYLELAATGRPIEPEAFGGPLSSVVTRIMRNLDDDERNIMRGVSFLDSFDAELAQVASGSPDAKITRFINSSLVVRTNGLAWPFALHSQLRKTIQESDDQLRDAWSEREWRAAADRVCAHLGAVSRAAIDTRDRGRVSACFVQATRIAVRYNTIPGWLFEAAQFLADAGLWQALDMPSSTQAARSPAATSLLQGLRGIGLRRSGSLERSVREFDAALSPAVLDGGARELLLLHRAHSLRNSGRYDQARFEYERIAREEGSYAGRARLQLADLHLLRGEFQESLQVLSDLPQDDPDMTGESLRIQGHVHRANCDLDLAELTYRRALDLGVRIKSLALEGKARTNLVETLCWTRPSDGLRLADEAIEFNENIGNQLEVLKAYVAKAVAATGDDIEAAVSAALRLAESCQYRAGSLFALIARLFHQIIGAQHGAAETIEKINGIADSINVYHYWCEIADWWADDTELLVERQRAGARADWLGSAELARQRWTTILDGRRYA
jgi:tetratricopeptide (TPR) repeat protein